MIYGADDAIGVNPPGILGSFLGRCKHVATLNDLAT